MNKVFNNWFGDSEEAQKLYAQESLIINTSEDFLALMDDAGFTKSKLSKQIGKSKSFVSQSLNGKRNLTLRTLADMAYAIGAKVTVKFELQQIEKVKVDNSSLTNIEDVVAIPDNLSSIFHVRKPKSIPIIDAQSKYEAVA